MPNNEVYYILILAKTGDVHKQGDGEIKLYPSRDAATQDAADLRASNPDQHYLVEGPKTKDALDWKARERARLLDGSHTPLIPGLRQCTVPNHFAHVAKGDPKALAYTKNDADGVRDIQKRMDVVAYLKIYAPLMSESDMIDIQRLHHAAVAAGDLKLAVTADEIVRVYTYHNRQGGVGVSCMRHDVSDYSGSEHPVSAYGHSDLAVAYVEDEQGRTAARAVVWPQKKVYSRMYGGDKHIPLLQRLMLTAGYLPSAGYYGHTSNASPHTLIGARIRAIPDENEDRRFVVPYLDEGAYGLMDDDCEWITIADDASSGSKVISIKETCGVARVSGPRCPSCNSNQYSDVMTPAYTTWPPSEAHRSMHCRGCLGHGTFVCDGTGERYNRNRVGRVNVGDKTYAQPWAEANLPMCGMCYNFKTVDMLLPVRMGLASPAKPTMVCVTCASDNVFWCLDEEGLVTNSLRVRALDVGSRKQVKFGERTKLIDRGYSVLSEAAMAHPDWTVIATAARAEAENASVITTMCYVHSGTLMPFTSDNGNRVRVLNGVIAAIRSIPCGYKVALYTAEVEDRLPHVGDWIRLSAALKFPEAAGHVGMITGMSGHPSHPFMVTLVDGREALGRAVDMEKLPKTEGVRHSLRARPTPIVGDNVMFCTYTSPRFGQSGVVEEIREGPDNYTTYCVRFPDGTMRRAMAGRIQQVGLTPEAHPDLLDYANKPWAVGDRARMLPGCASLSIPPEEAGKEGTIATIHPNGTCSTIRMDGGALRVINDDLVERVAPIAISAAG
jgi:hypothetical protein